MGCIAKKCGHAAFLSNIKQNLTDIKWRQEYC